MCSVRSYYRWYWNSASYYLSQKQWELLFISKTMCSVKIMTLRPQGGRGYEEIIILRLQKWCVFYTHFLLTYLILNFQLFDVFGPFVWANLNNQEFFFVFFFLRFLGIDIDGQIWTWYLCYFRRFDVFWPFVWAILSCFFFLELKI